jgi:phytoene dehydrogenase-like protein
MAEDQYDAIVIGSGISGLGLSAFLAKAGRRVLTLEKTKAIGGRAYSFNYKGHTTNMGGPRAGLENGKVDGMFAALGKEPGERGFFDDVRTYRDGELISLPSLAMRGPIEEAAKLMQASKELADRGDLAEYDAMSAKDWLSPLVKSPEVTDVARFSAIVMSTLPRLEDISASTFFEALRIIQQNPRIYLAAKGYGDFMRILAETSTEHGGVVRTEAPVNEIVVEDGRVRGVVVGKARGRRETIEAPLVVTAFPIWDLFGLVDESHFPADFVKKVQHLNRTTAIFGLTVALRQPLYEGKYFVLTDAHRAGYPLSGFMASNVAPAVSPQGEYLFEVCCQCEMELGDDRERLRRTTDLLKEDLEELFPGWDEEAIWIKPYFHWEEPARNPGREGIFRPGPKAPGVEGLYFTGDTVSSRSLPGLECAADSAMICTKEILGELPS